jgi:hypothetical protein
MLSRTTIALIPVTALCLAGATNASAQIRGSELGTAAQTVDGTTITVQYSRPVARGRELFGAAVPWDEPWTGANWATTLEVSKPIRLNGTEVPAGKYSVWTVPRQQQPWAVFLEPNAKLFHFQKPDSTAEQIRIAAQPETGPHTEMLTWSFPAVTGDGAVLRMQWGTTAVPLQVVVQPTKPVQLADNVRARYVGAYEMTIMEGMGWPTTGRLEVFEKDGMLRARLPFPIHPGDELEFDFAPAGDHRFSPGLYREGKLFNIEMGASFEFDVEGERATAVRLRGIEGTVFAEGHRAPQ